MLTWWVNLLPCNLNRMAESPSECVLSWGAPAEASEGSDGLMRFRGLFPGMTTNLSQVKG